MKAKIVRRSLTMLLILVLLCGTVPTVLAAGASLSNFQKVNKYTKGQFTDVKTGDWYYESVKAGYEYGLVKGTSESTYSPDNNITIAQSITLAARLHSIFNTGSESFVQGSPWYQVYVDYAVKNRIIGANEYSNYDAKATRAQFACILAMALPDSALQKINNITYDDIPDVTGKEYYAPYVCKLYNAGILTGSDGYGTFYPQNNIKRSEVAAIVTRMADPSLRKSVTLIPKPVAVTGIVLDKANAKIEIGGKISLVATVSPENATDKTVTWESTTPSIAVVSNGTVTGISEGKTTIRARVGEFTATCVIEVTKVLPTAISLNKTDMKLSVGKSEKLTATVTPANAADKSVIWSSSNPSVATVSNGTVTAVSAGTATITAKTSNGLAASCTVTVSRVIPGSEHYHGHVYTGGEYSTKYHYEPYCAGVNSHEITWDDVDRLKLTPCSKCVLH